MIEYVVNFDEMEEALENMLSSIRRKSVKGLKELKSKEYSLIIPPLKGIYNKVIDKEDIGFSLEKILILIDGYNVLDDFEILINGENIGNFTFTYNIVALDLTSPIDFQTVEIRYDNQSALYRNLNITLFLIKEEE